MRKFVLFALLALPAVAHAAPDVAMPEGLPFPEKPRRNPAGGDLIAWVTHEGYGLKKIPGEVTASGYKCFFMEPLIWHGEYQPKGGKNFLLLSKKVDSQYVPYGWIEEERCCCLQNTECLVDPGTRIQRKAFLVNTPKAIRNEADLGAVRPYLVPECQKGQPTTGALMLSNVLFIYGEFREGPDSERRFLLGNEPDFVQSRAIKDPKYAPTVVLGWVPESRVFDWQTREALEFYRTNTMADHPKRRTTPVKVFESVEAANKALVDPKVPPLFLENFDQSGISPEVPHYRMRFPLAPMKGGPGLKPSDDGGFATVEGGRIFRVGFAGPLVDKDGKVIFQTDEMADFQQRMSEIKLQLAVTEILFVIDGTSSMEKGFAQAAEAVEKIMATAKERPDIAVNIGVAIYKDLEGADETEWVRGAKNTDWRKDPKWVEKMEKSVSVWPMRDARAAGADDYLKRLRDFSKPGQLTGGGLPLEQVFHGLQRGIDRTTFQAYSRKLVIAIGDMGDHRDDADGSEAARVVDSLLVKGKKASPMEFIALQACDPAASEDTRRFTTQVQRICDAYNREKKARSLPGLPDARLYALGDQKAFLADIQNRYEMLRQQAEQLAADLKRFQNGQFNEIKSGDLMKTILEDREKIPLEKLKAGIQLFHEAFVFENLDGTRQVGMKYLMSKQDARDLLDLLSIMLQNIEKDEGGDQGVRDLNKILLKVMTGDGGQLDEKTTVAERLLKMKGLTFRSPLFNRTVKQLKNSRGGAEDFQELEDIKRRKINLERALENKETTWDSRLKPIGPIEVKEWVERKDGIRSVERLFKLPGAKSDGTQWIWVDCEREMP